MTRPIIFLLGAAVALLAARATYNSVGMFFGALRGLIWAILVALALAAALVGILALCGGGTIRWFF